MKKGKIIFIITSLMMLISPVWSSDLSATFEEINGKVDIKRVGGNWSSVKVGDVLSAGDSISTGFDGKAVLVLGNTSVLVVNALTRLTIAELVEKEGTVTTDLFLNVGNIRTEVHSSDTVSNDFQVRNANSTASVRGTVLDVEILGDGMGMKVMAWDGMAEINDIRTGRKASVGEQKKKKAETEDGDDGENSPEMGTPPEPPAQIAAAPLMVSGTGAGIVSSMASAIAASAVTVSTKPPSPAEILTGGGNSVSTEAAAAETAAVEEVVTSVSVPTTSFTNIQVIWPQ